MPEFLPAACPSLAWLLLGYALTVSGCAFFHKDNTADVELRARILPALDYQPPRDVISPNPPISPKAEPLPMPREVGGEEAEEHTVASPLAPPEALSLDRAIELARRMEASRRFAQTAITTESHVNSQTGDTEQFDIVAIYIPELPGANPQPEESAAKVAPESKSRTSSPKTKAPKTSSPKGVKP